MFLGGQLATVRHLFMPRVQNDIEIFYVIVYVYVYVNVYIYVYGFWPLYKGVSEGTRKKRRILWLDWP